MDDNGQIEIERGVAAAHGRARKTNPEWLSEAYDKVHALASTGRTFTSEDIWEAVGKPANADPRAMGGVFRTLHIGNYIRPTGEVKRASLRSRHRGLLRVWRGTIYTR